MVPLALPIGKPMVSLATNGTIGKFTMVPLGNPEQSPSLLSMRKKPVRRKVYLNLNLNLN